jgi:2'-5' RNA ligase
MSAALTHTTALCLIPPENVWEQIQSIRSVYDKAYPRWMPHINLVYPFAPESDFAHLKNQLDAVLNPTNSFEIEFDHSSIQYFKQKGSECTFHLRPKKNKDVVALQQLIQKCLPNYVSNARPFEPHLTLGQTTTARISDILVEMKAKWKTIKFTIDRVYLISRENDPDDLFSIKNQVLLVGSNENNDEPYSPMEIPVMENIPTISSSSSSKTNLCIIPPLEFSSRLLHLFEDTSFRPLTPFRIILSEYDKNPHESDLRLQIESIPKFTIDFGARSICFNYTTSRLFLKPTDIEPIKRLNFDGNSSKNNFDGTLTLGELDKKDLTEVGDRFAQSWSFGTNEFEVDRVHLIDSNGRFQCTFLLKSQCFS